MALMVRSICSSIAPASADFLLVLGTFWLFRFNRAPAKEDYREAKLRVAPSLARILRLGNRESKTPFDVCFERAASGRTVRVPVLHQGIALATPKYRENTASFG